jgi:hypothetical protein
VWLDPQERLTEVDEDRGMENTVGVEVEVLYAVVPQEAFEEVAGVVLDAPRLYKGGPGT